jgi:electron transfer flavoprotein alpha subunit
MGGDVHVLVAGSGAKAAADGASKLAGVSKVLHVERAHYDGGLAENYAALVVGLAKGYSHVVASASAFGKNFMPRVAALLDVAQVSEISGGGVGRHVRAPDLRRQRVRHGAVGRSIKVVTVRATGFDAAKEGGSAARGSPRPPAPTRGSRRCSRRSSRSPRGPSWARAALGLGAGGARERRELQDAGDARRQARARRSAPRARRSDSGYVPNDYQVGQTGKIVAPELYIAVGISGRDPAPRGHEGQQGDRRDQQGSRGADLPGRRTTGWSETCSRSFRS